MDYSLFLSTLTRLPELLRERFKALSQKELEQQLDELSHSREYTKLLADENAPLTDSDCARALPIYSPDYPLMLRELFAPPLVLFVRGNASALLAPPSGLNLAIVGSRRSGPRMNAFVERLSTELTSAGVAIVSGLAYGVDIAAHRGSLKLITQSGAITHHRPTVAVMGTPLEKIYPAAHTNIAEQIVEQGGALVSQYPSGSPVFPSNFIERNRLIAGLCHGVLVAQASERSGSLATARFALEENREVLVLPGDVTDEGFSGSNALLRAGAIAVRSANEVLESFSHHTLSLDAVSSEPPAAGAAIEEGSELSLNWLAALGREPIAIEQLLAAMPPNSRPYEVMFDLETRGKIERLPGDRVICLP